MNQRFFECKYPDEIHELTILHPYALFVFAWLVRLCFENKLPAPILTSIARTSEEDELEGAVSDSHRTLRAFDVSSKAYTQEQIEFITIKLSKLLSQFAAVNSEGEPRLVVYHKTKKGAWHFHFQVHAKYRLPEFKGMN